MSNPVIFPSNNEPHQKIIDKINSFLKKFNPFENEKGGKLFLFLDERSKAFYLNCHLKGEVLSEFCDLNASLEGEEEDELYKLNREVSEDQAAYKLMEEDALLGRSFEDIVLEYDTNYRPKKPLKVYGGQHRLTAISKAKVQKGQTNHGTRIYFELTRDQKVEIATINNTTIAVPKDLLDRMGEQLLGTELRDWCQKVGLLEPGKDFADRRDPKVPTVRLARSLVLNFYLGKKAKNTDDLLQPILCKLGGVDMDYLELRKKINWYDSALEKMGKEFALLHSVQKEIVKNRKKESNAEFARKALSLSVVASWAFAAGALQKQKELLAKLYAIPNNVSPPDDPLNAKALSEARLKGTDPDTYRGLGTRSSPKELGRMLEVFLVLVRKDKEKITKPLANAAIQSYEAKRATYDAEKVLGKI